MKRNWLCCEVSLERFASQSKSVNPSLSVTPATPYEKTNLYSLLEGMPAADETFVDVRHSDLEIIDPYSILDSSSSPTTRQTLQESRVEATESVTDDHLNDLTGKKILQGAFANDNTRIETSLPDLGRVQQRSLFATGDIGTPSSETL